MKKILRIIILLFSNVYCILKYYLERLIMQEFYVEYYFQSKDGNNEYIFPLFLLAENMQSARLISHQIQKELNDKFIIISVDPPRLNHNKFVKDYYSNKYQIHLQRNKLVNLQINTFEFIDYTTDLTLTFEENLEKAVTEGVYEEEIIAKSIAIKKYPIRVVKDKNNVLHGYDDYLLINLHGVK